MKRYFQALDGERKEHKPKDEKWFFRNDPDFVYKRGFWIIAESKHQPIAQSAELRFPETLSVTSGKGK